MTSRRVMFGLMIVGLALRLWQWLAPGTLWLDEIAVARNLAARSLGELLTEPLAFDQVAPLGFLAVVKLTTLAFGGSERALWLFPLLVGLAGVVLFRFLAERSLRGVAAPLALALFAIGLAPLRYAAEVKQYGIDAVVAVAMTLLALDLRARERSVGALLTAGAAGFAVIWFSQASALVMAGLGAALAVMWLIDRDRRTLRALTVTVPLWALASGVAVWLGKRSMTHSTHAYMQDFWRGGFLPLPARVDTAAPWMAGRLVELFGDPWTLRYPLPWLFAVLSVVGIIVLWRQRRDAALLIAAPVVVTLLAAIAQQYPFRQRLMVFLVPSALLAAAAGIGWLAEMAGRRSRLAAAMILVLAMAPPAVALARARIPVRVDNYVPIYTHLQKHRRPGDPVHVWFLANSSAIYYGPRYGLQRGELRVSACSRSDTRAYLRDLDRYRGQPRLWVVGRYGPAFRIPRDVTRRYLTTIGVRRQFLAVPSDVGDPLTLELYDLSDPARLRAADAETFPVTPMPEYPKPGCRDWSGSAEPVRRASARPRSTAG